MEFCWTICASFQKDTIIEENLTTNFIERVSTRNEYLEKFREYKKEYVRRWHKADNNKSEEKYKKMITDYIEYMKPYNKELRENKITKDKYLKILNRYIQDTR